MKPRDIVAFARFARSLPPFGGAASKARFHREGKSLLKHLATMLDLAPGSYDVRSNKGGPAITGEVTLHAESLYVQLTDSPHGILYRGCRGRKDCMGLGNNWMPYDRLLDLDDAVRTLRSVMVATAEASSVA